MLETPKRKKRIPEISSVAQEVSSGSIRTSNRAHPRYGPSIALLHCLKVISILILSTKIRPQRTRSLSHLTLVCYVTAIISTRSLEQNVESTSGDNLHKISEAHHLSEISRGLVVQSTVMSPSKKTYYT